MAPLIILIALILGGFLLIYGKSSLPETTKIKDPNRPDEATLALKGLGIFAVMFCVMSAALLLVVGGGDIANMLMPEALAR